MKQRLKINNMEMKVRKKRFYGEMNYKEFHEERWEKGRGEER